MGGKNKIQSTLNLRGKILHFKPEPTWNHLTALNMWGSTGEWKYQDCHRICIYLTSVRTSDRKENLDTWWESGVSKLEQDQCRYGYTTRFRSPPCKQTGHVPWLKKQHVNTHRFTVFHVLTSKTPCQPSNIRPCRLWLNNVDEDIRFYSSKSETIITKNHGLH